MTMEDGGATNCWEVYSCILFQRAAQGSRTVSKAADILTEVMHVYSTGGLTCDWGNSW